MVTRDQPTNHQSLITNRKDCLGAISAGLIVVAFCLILLGHDPVLFWNDDYEISILPVFADVARSWSDGTWPLLSPYSWVCSNLAGEFQYGTFSIFVNAAVVLIWKFPLSFPQQAAALSMIHLFVLGAGGYLLARGRNLSAPLSLTMALVTALNGWIICWGATNWFGALGAFAWLPWAWWSLERALDSSRTRWRFLWPAPFVYLLVTGGFPYTVLMLGILSAWLSLKSLGQTGRFSSIWPLMIGLALGFGLSAPAWLALLDYVRGSGRTAQDASAHFQWLVPITALPGFIAPNWTVSWADFYTRSLPHTATEMACGFVPPVALLAGLFARGRTLLREIKWELGLLVAILILSMLPSISVFRWSFRWLPFLHVVLALCAAEALRSFNRQQRAVSESDKSERTTARRPPITPGLLAIVLVGLITLASRLFHTSGQHSFPLVWICLGIAAIWAILERTRLQEWVPPSVVFGSLLATYLCLSPNVGVPRFNLAQELTTPAPLDRDHLYLSVYPAPEFAYHIGNKPNPFGTTLRIGSTSMWGEVRLLNGYSPIKPAGVAREFDFAVHGEINPGVAEWLLEHEAGPGGKLAQVGVDGIIVASEFGWVPKPDSEWELAVATEEGRVFHRIGGPLPSVRSLNGIDSRPGESFVSAEVSRIMNERNRVLAEVAVPAGGASTLLRISRPYFDGYRAKIGSVPLKVDSYRGLIPTIEIPAGTSGQFTLVYRPWWLLWGGTIALISLLLMFISVISALRSANAEMERDLRARSQTKSRSDLI